MTSNGGDAGRQPWDAAGYAAHAPFVPELGAPLVGLLAPQPGERILDIGCGDGTLTLALAEAGATVVGIDASPEMVAAAKARGLDARVADAAALPFVAEFDAAFSNAALHWVPDHDAAVAGMARALKPGGRAVGELGGFGNVAAIATALAAVMGRRGFADSVLPWHFPTAARFAERLAWHGFTVESCALTPRPTPLPTGMSGWLETFAAGIFGRLPPDDRTAARDEAVALLRPALRDEDGNWTADYVRLRFVARLTA